MGSYENFISEKSHIDGDHGFEPISVPDFLFDFQKDLVTRSIRKGRSAIFADCGLGKTPIQLVWADNICRKTNGRVLVVTPIAVGVQTVREGTKFGIEVKRSNNGRPDGDITITNYERLHLFDRNDFIGVVCDESSVLKNHSSRTRNIVTQFLRKMEFRLLCTATAAPNDYIELGTSSEALGYLGHTDMLNRFFKNDQQTVSPNRLWGGGAKWRFKRHGETDFWKWVASWARAVRRPSDLGYADGRFVLPNLKEVETIIETSKRFDGELFARPAKDLREQREERRATIDERCEMVAEKVNHTGEPSVVWCHLNAEADLIEHLVDDGVQVSGSDSDQKKEESLTAFSDGEIRVLITKPRIAAFGMNWQHCAHMTFFPSHSYEQYYQGVRRCWRFGQTKDVTVDIIATEGELDVLKNLHRKSKSAEVMFDQLIKHMNGSYRTEINPDTETIGVPKWM